MIRGVVTRNVDVLVIGAGQCGLAAANELTNTGYKYLLVDQAKAVGESWRSRYGSLTLFTPRSLSSLPGRALTGNPLGYASKDEFADYLSAYALNGCFPIASGVEIVSLRKLGATFVATSAIGAEYTARAVVVATGAFRHPAVPAISQGLSPSVLQLHVGSYRNTGQIKPGPVVVVGDGASGRDVAAELSQYHETYLARGGGRRLLPETILGRSTWWWLQRFGLLQTSAESMIGRAMRKADAFPNRGRDDESLSESGVNLVGRLVSCSESSVRFSDGSTVSPSSVVWASGYRENFGWIRIVGAVDAENQALQTYGVSPIAGLYFLGRPWQRNRASALIAGAGPDAEFVIDKLQAFLGSPPCERASDNQGKASLRSRRAQPTFGPG